MVALGSSIGENIASPAEKLLIPPLRLVLKDNGVKEEWALVAVRCKSVVFFVCLFTYLFVRFGLSVCLFVVCLFVVVCLGLCCESD